MARTDSPPVAAATPGLHHRDHPSHTPGPWWVKAVEDRTYVMAGPFADGFTAQIARFGNIWSPTDCANAYLCAAAPETAAERDHLRAVNAALRDALESLLAYAEDVVNDPKLLAQFKRGTVERDVKQARSALAKAEGK
jgi:hypothetical protein